MVGLFILAVMGVFISLFVHISTFIPGVSLGTSAWLINLLCAAIWTPLLLVGTYRIFDITNVGNEMRLLPRYAPEWTKNVAVPMLVYAMLNFFFTMVVLNKGGFPAIVDGEYVLHTFNYGRVLATLSAEQFTQHQTYLLRATSGHWIFLFHIAAMSAYSQARSRRLARQTPPNSESILDQPAH